MEETPAFLGSSSSTIWAVPGTPLRGILAAQGGNVVYRPAPRLAAGSEEEGSFPGPPTQLPSKPGWVCLATAAPKGPMPLLPRGGSTHMLRHPVLLQKLLLPHTRFVLANY